MAAEKQQGWGDVTVTLRDVTVFQEAICLCWLVFSSLSTVPPLISGLDRTRQGLLQITPVQNP